MARLNSRPGKFINTLMAYTINKLHGKVTRSLTLVLDGNDYWCLSASPATSLTWMFAATRQSS
ncbi:MAG: hypothetical protein LPD71_15160 [Shewanella sp.]|nr:hypothetical protein [Shewanella sp.]